MHDSTSLPACPEGARLIPLRRGWRGSLPPVEYATVDEGDFDHLAAWHWCKDSGGYAVRLEAGKTIRLHRVVVGLPEVVEADGRVVDHINGAKLDNRKSNLRIVTSDLNAANRSKQRNNKSGFKGVYWQPERGKWAVSIRYEGKSRNLGRYDDPEAAARAYDQAASELWGEFARLNFPQ